MLKLMRDNLKNLKWVLWLVVFVFVLLVFTEWGAGRGSGPRGMAGLAARVGDVTITEAEFIRELRGNEQRYREMFGEQWETFREQMDLPAMTLQNLIDRELLIAEARRMGLRVSDKEVLESIFAIPAFQREDGSFVGEEIYNRILRANQLSPQDFEAGLRREMLIQKLQQAIETGILIPDSEVEREYRRRNETAAFQVAFLGVERGIGEVSAGEDEARAFYQAHSERFTHPEQRQIRFLVVESARLRRELTVPEEQIVEYFQANQSEFVTNEQVRARHILIRPLLEDEAAWRDAERKARDVYAQATAPGADFAALARRLSDDPGSRDGGGDLGWFERGRMVPEFEAAVFALTPGAISQPVRSQFGYHVIRLEDRRPGAARPLAEVRETIRMRLVQGLEEAEGTRRAQALRERIAGTKPATDEEWRAFGDEVVSTNVTPFFSAGDVIPGLGRDPVLVAEAQRAKEGFIGGPHRITRGWVVYQVVRVRKAGTVPFEEVRDEATEGARRLKAVELLGTRLKERMPSLTAVTWREAMEGMGATVQEAGEYRRGTSIPGVGLSQALEQAVFATPIGSFTPVVPVGERGVAVARVTARTEVTPEELAAEKESVRQNLAQEELGRLLASILTESKRRNPPVLNPDVVERFRPRQG